MTTNTEITAVSNPYETDYTNTDATQVVDDNSFLNIAADLFGEDEESQVDKPIEEPVEDATDAEEDAPNNEDTDEPDTDNSEDGDTLEALNDDEELVIEVNGEPTKLTAKELGSGYMRQADYTRKTQEVAEERKTLKESLTTSEDALTAFAFENKKIIDSYNGVDWNQVAQTDPNAYAHHKQRFEQAQADQQNMVAEYEKVKTLHKIHEDAAFKAKVDEARETLHNTIPNWGQEKFEKLMTFAEEQGVNEETMNTTDPALIRLMNELMESRNAKAKLKEKIKVKTKAKAHRGSQAPHKDVTKATSGQMANPYANQADFTSFVM